MRKILCRAMLCLCLVLALGPVHTAFAQDLDRIESYAVDVTPNTCLLYTSPSPRDTR